jgi:hypothetical protein
MQPVRSRTRKILLFGTIVLIASIIVVTVTYHIAVPATSPATPIAKRTITGGTTAVPTAITPPSSPNVSPTPTLLPAPNPATVLGVDSNPGHYFDGPGWSIDWIRLGYPSCGFGNLMGSYLQTVIHNYHDLHLHVLLINCQPAQSGPRLFNEQQFTDLAQSGADAIQCGNEEMKQNALTAYVNPSDFARFYDLCERAVHAVQPNTPVLLGAVDPQYVGGDNAGLYNQVNYLNQMQAAMNTQVHPGGNWSWRAQILGLIDSWHNGYPTQYVNNLYNLFAFWAQQFNVDLNSGALGKHIWVVEGTGCFKGCGIDQYSSYQVAVSHVLTLITDAQTTTRYKVPFFYFSDRDFIQSGQYWPIGILYPNGSPKPIRQDLPLGARTLILTCAGTQISVPDQGQLLARLYQGCSLPTNYLSVLTS